mgnify:FL=1|jgi:hypothetical protein
MRSLFAFLAGLTLLGLIACKQPDPTPVLRQRFELLAKNICNNQPEACVELVDPVYVRAQGTDKVVGSFKFMVGLYKFMNIQENKVRIDEVLVLPTGKTAEIRYSLQVNGEWKPQDKPTKWLLVDGQWFLQL